jgi:preprotein translocase subunit SecE
VARNNGGRRSVDDEFPDDEPIDELEDAEDEDDDDLDDADGDEDDLDDEFDEDELEENAPVGRGRSVATSRASAKAARAKATSRTRTKEKDLRPGLIGRLINFVREVVAELQKVIWPTRKELLTYTTVVVVFVAIMMSFVAALDYGFARAMFAVFGSKTTQ